MTFAKAGQGRTRRVHPIWPQLHSARQPGKLAVVEILKQLSILAGGLALCSVGCGPTHVAVGVGGPPICPYGYYEVPPYNCAPDGYYGPEWFSGGAFIGAGPWYGGPGGFYGHVDHDFDYRRGYRGPFPGRGERPAERRAEFHGSAMHDPRGREAPRNRR